MPSTPSSSSSTNAAQEFGRVAVETSQRAADVAGAQARASRAYLADSVEVARAASATWSQMATAGLQVAFQVQNSFLEAAMASFDTASAVSRQALQGYFDFTRQTQRGVSEMVRAGFRPAEQRR
jgi:hypothetical protein